MSFTEICIECNKNKSNNLSDYCNECFEKIKRKPLLKRLEGMKTNSFGSGYSWIRKEQAITALKEAIKEKLVDKKEVYNR